MRKLIAALGLVVLAGCGDMLTDPFNSSLAGTFDLRSVDGQSLPYTLNSRGGTSATLVSDQLIVGDNGTWSEVYTYRQTTTNGQSTSGTGNDGGTWSRSGNNVTFRSSIGSDGYTGGYSGSRFTLSDGFSTYVFQK